MESHDKTTKQEDLVQSIAGTLTLQKFEVGAAIQAAVGAAALGCAPNVATAFATPIPERRITHDQGEHTEPERRIDYRQAEAAVTSGSVSGTIGSTLDDVSAASVGSVSKP